MGKQEVKRNRGEKQSLISTDKPPGEDDKGVVVNASY